MIKRIKHFDMSRVTEQAVEKFLTEAGMAVTEQAKMLSPWKTGLLRGSINWATNREQGGITEIATEENALDPAKKYEVKIGTNVEYGPWLEYGTKKSVTGRPYLRPALRILKGRIQSKWNRLLKEAMRG